MIIAQIFVWLLYAYLGIGLLIGIWFVFNGANKIDEDIQASKWPVRLLLLPASAALWPILLRKYFTRSST